MVNKWSRKCPRCKKKIYHTTKVARDKFLRKNCRSCFYKNKHNKSIEINDDCVRRCPKCNRKIKHSNYWNKIKFQKKKTVCKICSFEKMSETKTGHKHSEETKTKIRISLLNRIKKMRKGQVHHNPQACLYFNKLNKIKNWNLRHALNGGEYNFLGYSVDAYDIKNNIVVEYDEPYHYHYGGILKQKDIIRMNNIIKHLNCKFYRYDERRKILKEYEIKN